ncbi:1-deoxy-D-xylulose-5-phosphate synthase N-terminal domain-containing protein [Amycolatopsis sp. NPDC059657]|uniref:1-deoxy-D-xylulose-5-phosphate synthase N-terminal domain-containing protein n=1 Tax=Amycolatopsis sp. NPDC059657 TaxID=3346899 RepID=UPI00366DCA49
MALTDVLDERHATGLRGLSRSALRRLAADLHGERVDPTMVELTIALHRAFDSSRDVLLFDTAEQASVHRMLVDSRDSLPGHSTALSYADGLAKAFALRGCGDRRVVAVVSDASLTGGMCWEALNNIGGAPDRRVIIVLNDSGTGYDQTDGGIVHHLARLRRLRGRNVFAQIGFAYIGPVDGHDLGAVEHCLDRAKRSCRPVVVHLKTSGGAEPPVRPWAPVFDEELTEIGAEHREVVCVTTDPVDAPVRFTQRFPDRVFGAGMAEQHAVTSAAGLALGGLRPVVTVAASLLGRAFDQVVTDVAQRGLAVTFVVDGAADTAILPMVPTLGLAVPRDHTRLRSLLREAIAVGTGPTVVRCPDATVDVPALRSLGHCDLLRSDLGARVLLLPIGTAAQAALAAADELAGHSVRVTVADPRWVSPPDQALLTLAGAHDVVVVVGQPVEAGSLAAALEHPTAAVTDTPGITAAVLDRL